MKMDRNNVIIAVMILASLCVTVYTVETEKVAANFIYEDSEGNVWWRTMPSGSLFPWPRGSGALPAISEVVGVDLFIYKYLIKTSALVILSILLWIVSAVLLTKRLKIYTPKQIER